jgi:hypothetical protein
MKVRGGHKSLREWHARNIEPFRLMVDNSYTLYFGQKNEKETIVSFRFDNGKAYDKSQYGSIGLDDFVVLTDGIEEIVDDAETKASEMKRKDPTISYPINVYYLIKKHEVKGES